MPAGLDEVGEGSLEAPVCSSQVTPLSPVLNTDGLTRLSRGLTNNTDKCEAGVQGTESEGSQPAGRQWCERTWRVGELMML